jgi:hypothetical protein
MARAIRSINVRELMEALEGEDPEALVVFGSDYGDIGHTQQVLPITGEIEEVQVEETAYSSSGWAVRRDEDDDDDRNTKTVPILLIK